MVVTSPPPHQSAARSAARSNVSRCALQIEEVFREAGFPRGLFATVLVDSSAVAGLIDDPRIAAVTLTGAELDSDVGQWVYDQQKAAGRGTDTLPATAALYLPLKAPMRTRGVLAVASREPRELEVPEQQRMLDAFAAQIALALERVHYVEIARDAGSGAHQSP